MEALGASKNLCLKVVGGRVRCEIECPTQRISAEICPLRPSQNLNSLEVERIRVDRCRRNRYDAEFVDVNADGIHYRIEAGLQVGNTADTYVRAAGSIVRIVGKASVGRQGEIVVKARPGIRTASTLDPFRSSWPRPQAAERRTSSRHDSALGEHTDRPAFPNSRTTKAPRRQNHVVAHAAGAPEHPAHG